MQLKINVIEIQLIENYENISYRDVGIVFNAKLGRLTKSKINLHFHKLL